VAVVAVVDEVVAVVDEVVVVMFFIQKFVLLNRAGKKIFLFFI